MLIFSKVLQFIGTFSTLFGACAMDSDNVMIPLVSIGAGALILAIGTLIRRGYAEV